jgi:hypothetical protein
MARFPRRAVFPVSGRYMRGPLVTLAGEGRRVDGGVGGGAGCRGWGGGGGRWRERTGGEKPAT